VSHRHTQIDKTATKLIIALTYGLATLWFSKQVINTTESATHEYDEIE